MTCFNIIKHNGFLFCFVVKTVCRSNVLAQIVVKTSSRSSRSFDICFTGHRVLRGVGRDQQTRKGRLLSNGPPQPGHQCQRHRHDSQHAQVCRGQV